MEDMILITKIKLKVNSYQRSGQRRHAPEASKDKIHFDLFYRDQSQPSAEGQTTGQAANRPASRGGAIIEARQMPMTGGQAAC
jgi:hypothetical protein